MTEALAHPHPGTRTPDEALARYRAQFPQWTIRPVSQGRGYTAHSGDHRSWGPDLLTMALTMAAATGILSGDAPLAFPGRPGWVMGLCGHALLADEWRIGFRDCDGVRPAPRDRSARRRPSR